MTKVDQETGEIIQPTKYSFSLKRMEWKNDDWDVWFKLLSMQDELKDQYTIKLEVQFGDLERSIHDLEAKKASLLAENTLFKDGDGRIEKVDQEIDEVKRRMRERELNYRDFSFVAHVREMKNEWPAKIIRFRVPKDVPMFLNDIQECTGIYKIILD